MFLMNYSTVNLSFLKRFRDRYVTVPSPFRRACVTVPSIKKSYNSLPFLTVLYRYRDLYRYRYTYRYRDY